MKRSSFDWLSVRGASLFPAATGPVAGAGRSVHAAENGAERFALFFGRLVGGVAYGHKHHGFLVGRKGKEADTLGGVEVAHPARAEPLFCGGKAKMLRGDGHVNGAVRLAVGLAYPLLPFPATDDEAGRHLAEPAAVVAGGQLGEHSLICNVREVPRLKVDGRRSQTDALHDVAEHVFWYGVGTERAYRAPRATQVEKSFH